MGYYMKPFFSPVFLTRATYLCFICRLRFNLSKHLIKRSLLSDRYGWWIMKSSWALSQLMICSPPPSHPQKWPYLRERCPLCWKINFPIFSFLDMVDFVLKFRNYFMFGGSDHLNPRFCRRLHPHASHRVCAPRSLLLLNWESSLTG